MPSAGQVPVRPGEQHLRLSAGLPVSQPPRGWALSPGSPANLQGRVTCESPGPGHLVLTRVTCESPDSGPGHPAGSQPTGYLNLQAVLSHQTGSHISWLNSCLPGNVRLRLGMRYLPVFVAVSLKPVCFDFSEDRFEKSLSMNLPNKIYYKIMRNFTEGFAGADLCES